MKEEYSLWIIKVFLPVQIQIVKTILQQRGNGSFVKDHTGKNGHKKISHGFSANAAVISFLKQLSLTHINSTNHI
jgi:hypothetical protein